MMRATGRIFRHWRERRQRRAAIGELRALSDRTLKDMGLTRGEIVAAVEGWVYRGEPAPPSEPEPPSSPGAAPAETMDPAEIEAYIERARQRRAVLVVGLLRLGVGGIVRPLRGAVSALLRRGPARVAASRGPMTLDPPADDQQAHPIEESRHAARSHDAA